MKIQTTNSSQKFNGSTTEAKVRADAGGGRGESNGNPTGGAQECHLYLAGNRRPSFSGGNERSHNRFERENIFFHFKKRKFTIAMSANGRIAELILRFQVWVQLKQNVKETAEPHD